MIKKVIVRKKLSRFSEKSRPETAFGKNYSDGFLFGPGPFPSLLV